jgi:hypothetical protein
MNICSLINSLTILEANELLKKNGYFARLAAQEDKDWTRHCHKLEWKSNRVNIIIKDSLVKYCWIG